MNLVRNGWYVAILSDRLSTTPVPQTMLGDPMVLYRTTSGEAVALSDRCPHRFAPLHKGTVKGDHIECPYHGLQFNASGACAFNPHGDHKVPQAARVRHYPTVERDGIVWAWMGDPELAAATPAPDFGEFFGAGRWALVSGDFEINAHYETALDNLLDLSHAPFLHPTTLATADSVNNLRFEMKQQGNTVWAYHYVPDTAVTPQFAAFRDTSRPCDFHAHIRWDPPGTLQLDVGVTDVGGRDEDGQLIHMAHLLTPIDSTRTRYTWLAARNFVTDNAEVSKVMQQQVQMAFTEEDEPMIEAVWQYMGTSDLLSLAPVLLPGDAAGVRARRILAQLRATEAATTAQKTVA
ncbi:aromatic ring-hydroxylating dioxygenase subunit alpha [Ramlibacter sp. WS9]|uniref:aromatic ring-hydroxylating dioxygenase subunit alpha n=1 Tax=Ramlibacter sp. WS9 TaxID=1882741 RepID=UPI0011420165|nr:aromatic ring-hydroxylating dioxygenase subunit alpha [Ramlibacter sp. WS9]ROZ75055.1 aromatic ring-hydroxylating dioxygenase subunit alpha [Ramlibacter sp. WS9]